MPTTKLQLVLAKGKYDKIAADILQYRMILKDARRVRVAAIFESRNFVMKLRVRNNSIRLRLTQTEVAAFAESGAVEETIEFGLTADKSLIYRVDRAAVETVRADFADGKITISVPASLAENWAKTNQIGIKTEQDLGNGKMLKILIEKDFVCLDRKDDPDNLDAFPHPTGKCG